MAKLLCDAEEHVGLRQHGGQVRAQAQKLEQRLEDIWVERISFSRVETRSNLIREISVNKVTFDLGRFFLQPGEEVSVSVQLQ